MGRLATLLVDRRVPMPAAEVAELGRRMRLQSKLIQQQHDALEDLRQRLATAQAATSVVEVQDRLDNVLHLVATARSLDELREDVRKVGAL